VPSHLISISFDEDALTGKAVGLTANTDDCVSTTEGSARVELAVFIMTPGSDRANAMVVLLETWSLCGITSNVTCATLVLEEVIFP